MAALDGSTILVIGANGFLGNHLLTKLAGGPPRVHAVSRRATSDAGPVRWWQGSAADADWIRDLVAAVKPDVIYQLASAGSGAQDPELVLPTFENDLRTTVNTLVAAREIGGPRVILTRSLDEPLPECPAAAPSSPYAAAKAASGLYGRLFQQLYSVPVVMLRPFMTYGPGQKDFKIVPYTIRTMLKGESPALSSGTRQMDWVYVDDVIEAFIAAATVPDAVGAEIDLGSGSMTSIREVVEEIRALMPGARAPTFGGVPDRANEQIRRADTKTAEERLGWTAKTSLRDGLRQTIDAFRTLTVTEGIPQRSGR